MQVQTPKHFCHKTNAISTTSYTLFTFLPARLAKEMTKTFNLFFVILCCIVMVPNLTPFSKTSYILCIIFYICTSILKTGINEIKKYKLDRNINKKETGAIRHGKYVKIFREDINVGEKLIIAKNEPIPVDVLILAAYTETSDENRGQTLQIYIETSAIDGESALKLKQAPIKLVNTEILAQDEVLALDIIRAEYDPETLSGDLTVRLPSTDAHTDTEESAVTIPITKKNFIPMGASIYTDITTVGLSLGAKKKNSTPSRIKGSIFINMISRLSIYIIVAYIILLFISVISACWFMIHGEWLLGEVTISIMGDGMRTLTSNILIFSSLIPLSLFVTLDGLRISYSIFIQSDRSMNYNEKKTTCNTHGVLEDIGLVSHILSDKTGTLTLNKMKLKGVQLPGSDTPMLIEENADPLHHNMCMVSILTMLLCHSVCIVNGEYIGTSQEEVCALQYFKSTQMELLSNQNDRMIMSLNGRKVCAKILGVLPFSPAIARMSVIVLVDGKIFLLTKGSDEVVPNDSAVKIGGEYRTLAMAGAELSIEDIKRTAVHCKENPNREDPDDNLPESIDRVIELFERNSEQNESDMAENMECSGSEPISLPIDFILECEKLSKYTGTLYLEDALQPEVEQTVKSIRNKGINLWMVTGDRKESAVSCGLLSGMPRSSKAISGKEICSLTGNDSETLKEESLIIFRCSPEEKKKIAHMLRVAGNIVLSVGDGENDIGMIEEADIGVCVCGVESNRPSLSADLSIPSFSALRRLVLYHGPVALNRLRNVFLFFIFKSVCVAVCQCIYGGIVGASGSMAPSSLFLLFFNAMLTSPLSVEMGLFRRECLNKSIMDSFLRGVLYGVASFIVVYSLFGSIDVMGAGGELGSHSVVSCFFSLCLFISTVIYFIFSAESFVIYSFLALFVSAVFFIIIVGVDIGFEVFASPALYMCAMYMTMCGLLVERTACLLRRKQAPYQELTAIDSEPVV
ncbi:uncharacterized protein NEPG_00899 [Nematocida parisii ERTm1]|uniref:uncharacterized protein n=1 Tax=Nematocida parisii (strain ERTm1 / ATCC PRA-289) TaxID=881290 RepID=UPI000264B9DA|nr:uncharacterized protein NEPG_00899 [Nematocida parisii ERTm1]EIJ94232.1 hypothetical protein NEPG_00899 [Nematocida parisii ERTm1]|eukprot:XP_013058728.1 hypothetical protein NEPG_00899 [Nematocida parisii ERTm1]